MKIKPYSSILQMAVFAMVMSIVLSSCLFDKSGKKRSSGKTNEILVVTNTKAQWESTVGETIRDFFGQDMPGLPQKEAIFGLYNIAEKDLNKTFKAQHNLFIVNIDPNVKSPLIEIKEDLWSAPQLVIKITAPDESTFITIFLENKEDFLRKYSDLEIYRTNKYFGMAKSVALANKMQKKFGFYLAIPGGFAIAFEDDDFIWLRQTMHKVKQDAELGIIIYTTEYNDTSDFSPDNIIALRDSLTKRNVPGPTSGSYMTVSRQFIKPIFNRTPEFVTDFAVETRGLWRVENDFMGGPFISYTIADPEREKIITLDGYVYNPNGLKRNFIRQLEAVFYTLDFNKGK